MMASLSLALRAARELSPHSLALYAAYKVALQTGWLRHRTPIYDWDERPLAHWLRTGVCAEPSSYADYWEKKSPGFFFIHDEEFSSALRKTLRGDEPVVLMGSGSARATRDARTYIRVCPNRLVNRWGRILQAFRVSCPSRRPVAEIVLACCLKHPRQSQGTDCGAGNVNA